MDPLDHKIMIKRYDIEYDDDYPQMTDYYNGEYVKYSDALKIINKQNKALKKLIHLHWCDQEGIEDGQPSPKEWQDAINDAENSLMVIK